MFAASSDRPLPPRPEPSAISLARARGRTPGVRDLRGGRGDVNFVFGDDHVVVAVVALFARH